MGNFPYWVNKYLTNISIILHNMFHKHIKCIDNV